jgi:hypothetical protein
MAASGVAADISIQQVLRVRGALSGLSPTRFTPVWIPGNPQHP